MDSGPKALPGSSSFAAAPVKLAGRTWRARIQPQVRCLLKAGAVRVLPDGEGPHRGLAKSGLATAADIMACTVEISFHDQHRLLTNRNDRQGRDRAKSIR